MKLIKSDKKDVNKHIDNHLNAMCDIIYKNL